jgi:hypothetical protein
MASGEPSRPGAWRWTALVFAAFAVGGWLLGYAVSGLPAPDDPAAFWAGNFSTPWAVLAFAAGMAQGRRRSGATTALAAEVSCVAGFYTRLLFLDAAHQGLAADTPAVAAAVQGLAHWLGFIAPWLAVGVGAGVLYGALGARWAESRWLPAGLALAFPFFIEPLAWPLYLGRAQGPVAVWVFEVTIGLVVLWFVARSWRGHALRGLPG